MKKLFITALFIFVSSFVFATPFEGSEELVINFLERGTYIKIVEDADNYKYITKESIGGLIIDDDEIEIFTTGRNVLNGSNGDYAYFNIGKWFITSDEKANIIISPKPKK